jgi:uracil-DNA glycosylase
MPKRMEIDNLNAGIKRCNRCRLCETRANAFCGDENIT